MKNIKEILSSAKEKLRMCGIAGYDSDAEFLLAHVLGVGRSQLLRINTITDEEYSIYNELISRRLNHEPMDSIIGYTEYLGLTIPFSRDTLTPRQETEIMVDNIIRENKGMDNLRVLDLCSGSGCIGLAVAKHLGADVTLSDISDEAMKVAKQNAEINNISATFIISNLFDNITGKFDIIISNPPYIPSKDISVLEVEVREYDPILALDGGEDGLDFYRKIISYAPKFLNNNGRIYLEFGINQAEDISRLMQDEFEDIEIVRDYSGIERYIRGIKKNAE